MSENKNQALKSSHEIVLISREKLSISGVKEIINFDENELNLITLCGNLMIDGNNIHINVLNVSDGELEVNGEILGINYYDTNLREKRSILSKIFK